MIDLAFKYWFDASYKAEQKYARIKLLGKYYY